MTTKMSRDEAQTALDQAHHAALNQGQITFIQGVGVANSCRDIQVRLSVEDSHDVYMLLQDILKDVLAEMSK